MMYTIREAVSNFMHLVGDFSGSPSDDHIWSLRNIAQSLIENRAIAARNAIRAGEGISQDMVQTLPCVKLALVDKQECPCAPATGCLWLKTEVPIPTFVKILSVSTIDGSIQFSKKDWTNLSRINKSRITSAINKRYYVLKEHKGKTFLYIHSLDTDNLLLKSLTVTGVASDIIGAATYPVCGSTDLELECKPLDLPFYTSEELRELIFRATISALLPAKSAAISDTLNNDRADRAPYERRN